MNKLQDFREELVNWVRSVSKNLHLEEPTSPEDEHLLAATVIAGLGRGARPRILAFERRPACMIIAVRSVSYLGSPGDSANRTCPILLKRLFASDAPLASDLADQLALMGLLVEQFVRSPRTVDDLLAHLVNGSNCIRVWTRAFVDWRDGEILVRTSVPCDFQSLPSGLEACVSGVLDHAERLICMERFVREILSPEPRVPQSVLELVERRAGELLAKLLQPAPAASAAQEDPQESVSLAI